MVKNLPFKAGDEVSHLGRGARILHALGQLSLCATTGEARVPESTSHNYRARGHLCPR